VCIYADPPYLGTTRSSRQYRVEMSHTDEHEQLAAALHHCAASVVLSGYDSDLYQALYRDWWRVDLTAFTGQANTAGRRIEVLWCNRDLTTQPTLWDHQPDTSAQPVEDIA
jgi:DNA adenine methylase